LEPALSVVIVAWNSGADLARTLPALSSELGPADEVIVVDNGGGEPKVAFPDLPRLRVDRSPGNVGFAAAANRGASLAGNDLILFLNPDAAPLPGFGEAIRRPATDRPEWDAWMGLVACRMGGSLRVNSRGNPVHFTGIAWAGGHGEALEGVGDGEVPTASGACLVVRRAVWSSTGGFAPDYFLYQEDTDLSLRIRSRGGRIGLAAKAVVEHDYLFEPDSDKWFWLERNRLATVFRNYPGVLLVLVAPVLALTELVLFVAALRGGWAGAKVRAWRDLARWVPRLVSERRALAAGRTITPAQFARILTPDLESPFLPVTARRGPVRLLLRSWWAMVTAALG